MKKDLRPTLILVCGLLSDEAIWHHQYKYLIEIAQIKIIRFIDEDTPEKMIHTILKQAPEKFALAGHSMGGWLALEIMRTAAMRVSKLCLLNTTARDDPPEKLHLRKEMIKVVNEGQFSIIAEKIAENFIDNLHIRKEAMEMFLRVGKQAFINQEKAMIIRNECMSILPRIACPTLVIHAMQDKIFSLEEHEELARKIPHAKLAIIEDSGHISPMEQPQAVTAFLRFWLTYF